MSFFAFFEKEFGDKENRFFSYQQNIQLFWQKNRRTYFKSIAWTVDLYLTQTTQIFAETMQDRTGLMKGIRRGIHCFARMLPSGWGAQAECARSAKVSITYNEPRMASAFSAESAWDKEYRLICCFLLSTDYTDYIVVWQKNIRTYFYLSTDYRDYTVFLTRRRVSV